MHTEHTLPTHWTSTFVQLGQASASTFGGSNQLDPIPIAMIQVHIPTYQNIVERGDAYKKYTAFDIHVNGTFHASVRYSHLCTLHEKLIENFGFRFVGPEFPPKKMWRSLDAKALNERREGLAKYFQGLIQINDIARHHILERGFLEFQVNYFQPTYQTISIEIYLPDGSPVKLDCYADDATNVVQHKLCRSLGVGDKFAECFGLFLARDREVPEDKPRKTSVFNIVVVRWLKNFESPFISQAIANKHIEDDSKKLKIVIRRITWDPTVEEPLLEDPGALKLLYLQALNDLHHKYIDLSTEDRRELLRYSENEDFSSFVRACHRFPSYGYEILDDVDSDYPSENTKCMLKVGRRMLVLQYTHEGMLMQSLLRSTRIRTWKISHTADVIARPQTTFQIEYVLGSGVDIITFYTPQAVLISLCLQSIADEILRDQRSESPTYKFDDTIQTKVVENLRRVEAESTNGEGSSSDSTTHTGKDSNSNFALKNPLFTIVSYTMPFEPEESFADLCDADL
uniref:PX domain-containing protein n=1 Tax=Panagrellus redivivus TaxID=6233 RepID=A0A7E4VJJ4_PANRE